MLDELFGEIHVVLVVPVGAVIFEEREVGKVRRVEAFVAEAARELVHALEPARDRALEVRFGRDPQVHVDVERVVVGDERPRQRAARLVGQHRRVYFHKAVFVKELADGADDPRALLEPLHVLGRRDEVEIPAAVHQFLVGEAVELLRQGPQRFGQKRPARHVDGLFARARGDDLAFDADEIPHVNSLHEQLELLRQLVLLEGELHGAGAIEQVAERELAEPADRDDAACGPHRLGAVGKLLRVGKQVRLLKALRIRKHAAFAQHFDFVNAYRSLVVRRPG